MDNTGNKPRRPSLFNTGPSNATSPVATTARVDKALATGGSGRARRHVFWLGAIVVLAIVGASAFFLLRDDSPPATGVPPVATVTQPAVQPAPAGTAGSSAVLLPDNPASADNPLKRLRAARQPAVEPRPGSDPAAGDAPPAAVVDVPPAPPGAQARAPGVEASQRSATRRPATRTSDAAAPTELMRTLLGHIKGSEPQRLVAPESPRSLDDLVQDLLDRSADSDALDTSSRELQQALRTCPAANSVSGIACRQQICRNHVGRDPACPRQ